MRPDVGRIRYFWLSRCGAEIPPIYDFGSAVVFEAAFSGKQACFTFFWVESVPRFRVSLGFGVSREQQLLARNHEVHPRRAGRRHRLSAGGIPSDLNRGCIS